MGGVTIDHLNCNYETIEVVKNLSLTAGKNQILSILGPSGCGKSTLLRSIAGFHRPKSGRIEVNGQCVYSEAADIAAEHRGIGWVSQELGLFPHLNIQDNIAFGQRYQTKSDSQTEIQRLLELVGLPEYGKQMPHELSGGQQQRVAIARALAIKPKLLLLDEPFSGLDASLRQAMGNELRKLLKHENMTAIMVTHDQDEAFTVSDSIAVMNQGEIHQLSTPDTIYKQPATSFVAEFIGTGSWLDLIQLKDKSWTTVLGGKYELPDEQNKKLKLWVRPEHIRAVTENGVEMTIGERMFAAGTYYYRLHHSDAELIIRQHHASLTPGERLQIEISATRDLIFPNNKCVEA